MKLNKIATIARQAILDVIEKEAELKAKIDIEADKVQPEIDRINKAFEPLKAAADKLDKQKIELATDVKLLEVAIKENEAKKNPLIGKYLKALYPKAVNLNKKTGATNFKQGYVFDLKGSIAPDQTITTDKVTPRWEGTDLILKVQLNKDQWAKVNDLNYMGWINVSPDKLIARYDKEVFKMEVVKD